MITDSEIFYEHTEFPTTNTKNDNISKDNLLI